MVCNPYFIVVLQGRRKSWRAQQPDPDVPGRLQIRLLGAIPLDAKAETVALGARKPWRPGRRLQRCQHGHQRVPVPVQQPPMELFHQELPARQKSVRQNRRQR